MSFYFGFNSPEQQKKRRKADLQAIGKSVTDFFWDVAPEHGFEMREGQQDMSFEIVDALIRHPGHCTGDCANCPPHYGYRYGRWYYGHGHQHGCEFGGNKGDGSL